MNRLRNLFRAFYYFLGASTGVFMPYWTLYLQSLGFNAKQIGELMTLALISRMVAPIFWGWIADRNGTCQMRIIRITLLVTCLIFSSVFLVLGYYWMGLVMILFIFFWNSVPLFEVVTLNTLCFSEHYSYIRLWASIGIIISSMIVGSLLSHWGYNLIPVILFMFLSMLWIVSLSIPEQMTHSESVSIRVVFRRPGVLAFLSTCLFMQAGHGPLYIFFSIYLATHHYSSTHIGLLWALSAIAEIGMFSIAPHLLQRFSLRQLILVSVFLAGLRWLIIGFFVDSSLLILLAQLLHAATSGLFHIAAIALILQYFTGNTQSRGQALYSSLSFGAGGAIGSFYSGYLWDLVGPEKTFLMAVAVTLVAFWSALHIQSDSSGSEN
jgi:PPP family 3-phenylpropionic acid transporter